MQIRQDTSLGQLYMNALLSAINNFRVHLSNGKLRKTSLIYIPNWEIPWDCGHQTNVQNRGSIFALLTAKITNMQCNARGS